MNTGSTDTMKTRYRYIHFKQARDLWICFNNKTNEPLCSLEYYPPWFQWVLASKSPTSVFSDDCLQDIAHFMGQLPKPDAETGVSL